MRVVWRLGGTRGGAYQSETFSAGTDAQNLARADGFKKMVDAAGQRWPDGWVKGEGFVRPAGTDPLTAPPRFVDLGEEYVRQIVDLSPGQRKRYLGHLKVLGETRVRERGAPGLVRRLPAGIPTVDAGSADPVRGRERRPALRAGGRWGNGNGLHTCSKRGGGRQWTRGRPKAFRTNPAHASAKGV
ncbi:MAG: hypothetical protein M3130_00665 [Actinomycetota bacterium]|nr:hypothetical protein [Actinomycetota bacterium]